MTQVQCSQCGRSFIASAGGGSVMCPECGKRVDPMLAGAVVPMKSKGKGLAIASLVLGIVGILPCFCAIPSLLATIFWRNSAGQRHGRQGTGHCRARARGIGDSSSAH